MCGQPSASKLTGWTCVTRPKTPRSWKCTNHHPPCTSSTRAPWCGPLTGEESCSSTVRCSYGPCRSRARNTTRSPSGTPPRGALVRTVDGGGVLLEHDPVLVRTVQFPGTEHHLVAVGHPAGGRVDPVPAALAVGLGALEREHPGQVIAVDDHLRGRERGGEIR